MDERSKQPCYVCGKSHFSKVDGTVRDIPRMPIFKCSNCGLVFLGSNSHIDDSFYQKSNMYTNKPTWEEHLEACRDDDMRRASFLLPLTEGKEVLDIGCGAGGFLLYSKETSSRVVGVDLDSLYLSLIADQGIDTFEDISEVEGKFDVITLFHVVEHLKDPREFLTEVVDRVCKKDSRIIVEVPNANDALLTVFENKEFKEFTYWGCHLNLFTENSLLRLVESIGLKVEEISQVQRYPLSNHLFWMSNGKPRGHKVLTEFNGAALNVLYENALTNMKACDTLLLTAKV